MNPQSATVVIPSFNYGRFLRNAVDSVLRQQPRPQVVVVDDGSSDDSPAILASYGEAIEVVCKENGGHASAINVGCRLARGEVVFLLDADDEMRADAVATVLQAWRPETVLAHWRPSQMDADGRDIPGTVPAPWVRLEEGDVRERILTTGGFDTTVTSGLALSREALMQVLPIPEDVFRQGADGYLVRAMAFLGYVQAIDLPLTRYRRHGDNDSDLGASHEQLVSGLRRRIEFKNNELGAVPLLARQHGLTVDPHLADRDEEFLFVRLASLKLDPVHHPVAGDRLGRLLFRLLAAQLHAARSLRSRLAAAAFAGAIALAPRALDWKLLAWRHTPKARPGWLAALASWRHRAEAR